MSTAELNKTKLDLIDWINKLSDQKLISFLNGIKNSTSESDWWDVLSEEQKKRIDKGIGDTDKGKLINSKEFWHKLN